jgi:r-opsin
MREYLPPDVLEMLHPFWHRFPPQHQLFYNLMALIYTIGGFLSVTGNLLVLWIFAKYAKLRSPSNILVMNLAFCDLMCMATMVPECIVNFFMGGVWQFGDFACQFHAFCGSLFGYGQIATLIFISWDRYNVVVNGMAGKPLTYGRVMIFLIFIWVFASFWAVGPMIGYGSYALDGILATCSYGFMDQSFTNKAYILGCFAFAYVFPLMIISVCYWHIVKAVIAHERAMKEQAKKMNVASLKSNADANQQSVEIKIAKVAMLNVTLWVFAWTPFAVICLIGVLSDQSKLTPLVSALPILFAKMSCVYNPIIYSLSHPRFRQHLKKALPWFCITIPGDNASTASGVSGTTDMKQEVA